MRTERVVLPEPGRTLLRRTYGILLHRLRDQAGEAGFVIGGGTMLAARWGHRESKDLDIKVNNSERYRAVSRMHDEPLLETSLDREMHAVGARAKKRESRWELIYVFGDKDDKDPPRIELVELAPHLRGQMIRTESEGMSFWSATNEEILAGKWIDRREHSPVRDVFDFAVAAVTDGHALQRALATEGTGQNLDAMVEQLADEHERYSTEAGEAIRGAPREFEHIHQDPARFCAWAIGRWALTGVEIVREAGRWVVKTRCRAENEGAERGRYKALKAAVERAADLGGLPTGAIGEAITEAHDAGGISRTCGGSQVSQPTGPEMDVDARGSVLIRDFARESMLAPTIHAAVEVAIERGWESRERAQAVTAEMEELQNHAIAKERAHARQDHHR